MHTQDTIGFHTESTYKVQNNSDMITGLLLLVVLSLWAINIIKKERNKWEVH